MRYNITIEQIIEVGDFITVVEWTSHKDNSYKGDCLEVLVTDENLLRVVRHTGKGTAGDWDYITLNLDQVVVRELSDDFVVEFM